MFLKRHFIGDFPKNTFGENTSIKNILNKNTVIHTLKIHLTVILENVFNLKSIF